MESPRRLLSSGCRSAPVAVREGRPSSLHYAAALQSVKLQDLLPQARRRRRKFAAIEVVDPEEFDPALGFWRSARLLEYQIPESSLQDEPADYFISHVWQPWDQAQNRDQWAEEKVALLKLWATTRKAMGDDRDGATPWFLLESDQERREALLDPARAWHNMRCWVDKACAHRGFATGCPAQEAIRASKDALANCHTLVALVSHPGYFRRLWCCFELVFFVVRVAPHYRNVEFLLPEPMLEPAALAELARAAASVTLPELLATGQAQRAELLREMEALEVDEVGFRNFLRSTLLALLGLSVLLRCAEGCAAFSGGSLDVIAEACWEAGLRGLSKVLSTATPGVWWRTAYRHVRRRVVNERHHMDDPSARKDSLDSDDDRRAEHDVSSGEEESEAEDPLEMLAQYVNQKFFGGAKHTHEARHTFEVELDGVDEEGEEEEEKEDDPVVEEGAEEPEEMQADQEPLCTPREAGDFAAHYCMVKEAAQRPQELALECVRRLSRQLSQGGPLPTLIEALEETTEADAPEMTEKPSEAFRGQEESNAWKCVLARSGLVVAPGFEDFWHGATGEPLEADTRANARVFFESWQLYRRRVCKWFDSKVVPQLEVWRQRGVRTSGIFEEAFRDVLLQVGGSVQDDLHRQLLSPKEEPNYPAEQRPAVWTNPTLGRLLVLSRRQKTFQNHTNPLRGDADSEITDLSLRPAILMSTLPLRVAEEPRVSVVCARPFRGPPGWRRAVALQSLGAPALSAAVYQLLVNFTSDGCTQEGVEAEVLVPRLLLQVRGALHCQVVCGVRMTGRLEAQPVAENPGTVGGREQEEETPDGSADACSSGSSSGTETQAEDGGIDWSSWIYRVEVKEAKEGPPFPVPSSPVRRVAPPKSPRVTITEIHRPESRGEIPCPESPLQGRLKHRTRKWWSEPTGHAEKLLPSGVMGKRQKLPLIRELRLWRPAADLDRGLERTWPTPRRRDTSDRLPAVEPTSQVAKQLTPLPNSARHKSIDAWKLRESKWSWRAICEGGPTEPSKAAVEEERRGSLQDHFQKLYHYVQQTCFAQWVALNLAAESQARPMQSGCYTGGGGSLMPPQLKDLQVPGDEPRMDSTVRGHPWPLDASEPCERCGRRCLAFLPLQGSLMEHIWGCEACVVCLRCGFARPDNGETRAQMLLGDEVLEVTTSMLLRPGRAEAVQRCIARVLRVESCVCCVGMVKEVASTRPTRSSSRVASVSFGLADTTLAAAATVMTRTDDLDHRERRSRPFAHDLTWITSSLADTGLDLFYNKVRDLSVDVTVEEIDDVRMLRLRKEVSPLILWLELAYVLSPEFDLITWNGALAKIFGAIKLPAAVLMRMNINRLRHMAGAGKLQDSDRAEVTTPLMWPLALHRVLVAPKESSQETLAIAMRGAGLLEDSISALRQRGKALQEEHFAAVEEEIEKEFDEGKQDVGKVSVATIMTILSKTRSFFGAASTRALMQARRILRRKQVFIYLRGLHSSIVLGDKEETAKVRQGEAEESESETTEDSHSELDDELQEMEEEPVDEDLMIHLPLEPIPEDRRYPLSGLTIIKVLGHFREYVYFSQMALMSIQVLGVMVRSAIRLHSKASTSVTARGDGSKTSATPIEQVMLRHGFVESAMRALYRHAAIPEICREVLLLLKYLVQDDMGHDESVRAQIQLLTPAERPMTLILAMARLSYRQDRSNLLLCLEVYVSLGPHSFEAASSPLPSQPPSPRAAQAAKPPSRRNSTSRRSSGIVPSLRLPVQREAEAAEIFVTILRSHWQDEVITLIMLKIAQFSCEQPHLCRHFFAQRLSSELRRFLRRAGAGEVEEAWFEEMKKRTGMSMNRQMSKGRFKKMKELAFARSRVAASISLAESSSWQLLYTLAVNTAGRTGGSQEAPDLEAHPNYAKDAAKCIHQALEELERGGSQWTLATQYLEAMLLFDLPSHGACFEEKGGLQLILEEFPDGKVAEIFPLLAAILRHHLRSIPECTEQYLLSDDDEDQLKLGRSISLPRPVIERPPEEEEVQQPRPKKTLKAKTRSVVARRQTLPMPDLPRGDFISYTDHLLDTFKATLVKSKAVPSLLSAFMMNHGMDTKLQDGLLRVLADLLQDKACGASDAAKEFQLFGADGVNGPLIVLELMNGSLSNADRVDSALYALAGALKLNSGVAGAMASELAVKLLIEAVWQYRTCKTKRRRGMALLRKIRDADPDLTASMLRRWKAHVAQFESGQGAGPRIVPGSTSPSLRSESEEHPEADALEEAEASPPARSNSEQAMASVHSTRSADQGSASMPLSFLRQFAGAAEEEVVHREEPLVRSQLDEEGSLLAEALPDRSEPCATKEESPAPAQEQPTKAKVVLPREMRHFLALLRVHRFEQKSSILAVPDVVQAIVDFGDDPELALFGVRSLMTGVPLEQEMRFPTIGRCPDFAPAVLRILLRETSAEGLQLMQRMVYGILDNDPTDYQGWIEVAARGIARLLDATATWTSSSWEVMLKTINETMYTPQGRNRLYELNTYHGLEKVWEKLKTSDETLAKMLVSSYHDQTERTLELLS